MAWWKKRKKMNPTHDATSEFCVLCGHPTEERKDTPVNERKYYAEGCGSLCRNCYLSYFVMGEQTVSTNEAERFVAVTKNETE